MTDDTRVQIRVEIDGQTMMQGTFDTFAGGMVAGARYMLAVDELEPDEAAAVMAEAIRLVARAAR